MHINDFPLEILTCILEEAAKLNERDGVTFTFGLAQPPLPGQKAKLQRYIRGPVPPALIKWDSTNSIRKVCSVWHEWALSYAMKDVFVRKWRGSERWAELSQTREQYGLYELIEKPSGAAVYRNPYQTLHRTGDVLSRYPNVADKVRRMWFDGFYISETDAQISSIIRGCANLTSISIPWTTLRHLGPEEWQELLVRKSGVRLKSLELMAVDLTESQMKDPKNQVDLKPLESPLVNFGSLKRFKLFGDTSFMPVNDQDLLAIARTATNLEEFQLTCISTVTINGVMAIVKASQKTLRVLEHSPRSDDGFFHPHPGSLADSDEHLCEILSKCPRLEDLSVSLPSMCATIFSNPNVRWTGDLQVRALQLCEHHHRKPNEPPRRRRDSVRTVNDSLQELLDQARRLVHTRNNGTIPANPPLTVELFFADFIFDPHLSVVHGDFQTAEMLSNGMWPQTRSLSRKGPYGTTGLYGKEEEETLFEKVPESEFLRGLMFGYVRIPS